MTISHFFSMHLNIIEFKAIKRLKFKTKFALEEVKSKIGAAKTTESGFGS